MYFLTFCLGSRCILTRPGRFEFSRTQQIGVHRTQSVHLGAKCSRHSNFLGLVSPNLDLFVKQLLFRASSIIMLANSLRCSLGTLDLFRQIRRALSASKITNPYETQISRRREVEDISIPKTDGVECLKWTNWRMRRDVLRRHMNARYWQYRNDLMSIANCRTLPSVIRDIATEERNSTPRDASVNHLRNRCALTSRNRGKLYKYRLSRIVWRDLADHGMISGAIRAKWG